MGPRGSQLSTLRYATNAATDAVSWYASSQPVATNMVLAVLTNFIPVLHTNVVQVPVTNLENSTELLTMAFGMRKCNCSGNCGPQGGGISRREFLGWVGTGAAATFLTGPALGAQLAQEEFERWKKALFEPTPGSRYSSDTHTDARMHLGGIGTGNFEIGVDGQLTTWQLFNTLRDGQLPFHFVVKAGKTAKLLQTAGGPAWPRIKRIEMTGEYPVVTLWFEDDDLPVKLELSACSPFAPLDTRLSSQPLALFHFRIHNPTAVPQPVSLGAMLINPIGYDALGQFEGLAYPGCGGNVNEWFCEGTASGLLMRAERGKEPRLDRPVCLYALANLKDLNAPPPDRPENLTLKILEGQLFPSGQGTDPEHTLIWLEEAPADVRAAFLREARERVRRGATLVFSGRDLPLLQTYAAATNGQPPSKRPARPDIVFEDFEHGYEKWTLQGNAFGKGPVHGTLPNQQPVSGFLGQSLVNSYVGGDESTGRLTSQPFTIERPFIRFLVGGGHHAETQIRLVCAGKVVRATAGRDNERLEPAVWNVHEFAGQSAHLEIVDERKDGWGHINVDQIVFSDQPGDPEVQELLDELLPASFSAVDQPPARRGGSHQVSFRNLQLQPDSSRKTAPNGLTLLTRPIRKGKVVLASGSVLDPAQAGSNPARQRAYAMLCSLAGAKYTLPGGQSPKSPGFGTVALATLGPNATGLLHLNDLALGWKTFERSGRFTSTPSGRKSHPSPPGQTNYGALASTVEVPAGSTVEVPFLFAWHYPNSYNRHGTWIGCHYAAQQADARAVMREAVGDYSALRQKTEHFRATFYDSTLPYWLLDCITANAAILRHIGVVFRITNADIYGWEGSNGCCDPTCTHVWGYEQSLARLFPDLEREMRRIDFKHQQRPDGGINNRTEVPSPPRPTGEQPFADGHSSCILKAYREALNCTDESFFKEYWPHAKLAVEYLIERDARSSGGQPAGVLQDDQWNTYDEALHGVTTFISGYYLAALRAGEEWARRMGDTASAGRFHQVFESGQKKLLDLCWNGEYFQQHLPDYQNRNGEFGPGCMADQLIGQWWAHQLGLGYLLPKEHVVSALRAIFKYNFKSDLTGWKHQPRAFAGAGDKGLIVCTWPRGGRPANVMLYSDEVWTGIEYQVAAHMFYEGLIEEGFAIVKGARDRYDGRPRPPIARNPWSEIECGGHYARAMSSWSLLLAISGYEFDGPRAALRFHPRHRPDNFKSFFTGPEGWGSMSQKVEAGAQNITIGVKHGKLRLRILEFDVLGTLKKPQATVSHAGRSAVVALRVERGRTELDFAPDELMLNAGEELEIALP
jgi:uncharacterized protein (DUF608 family)